MTSMLLLLVMEFFMIFFLVLGYLLRFKGRADLISRYHKDRVKDTAGLSRWIGNNLLVLAVLALISFIGLIAFPDQEVLIFSAYTVLVVPVMSVITAFGSRRFEQDLSPGR